MKTRTLTTTTAAALALAFMIAPLAYAETGTSTGERVIKQPKTTMDLPCVQSAIDTREDAIATAFTTFSTAESAALSARKSALHDAWGKTTSSERRTAREKAWSDFRTANKAAYSALRTARKDAWQKFETASKACKVPVVETASSEGAGSLGL